MSTREVSPGRCVPLSGTYSQNCTSRLPGRFSPPSRALPTTLWDTSGTRRQVWTPPQSSSSLPDSVCCGRESSAADMRGYSRVRSDPRLASTKVPSPAAAGPHRHRGAGKGRGTHIMYARIGCLMSGSSREQPGTFSVWDGGWRPSRASFSCSSSSRLRPSECKWFLFVPFEKLDLNRRWHRHVCNPTRRACCFGPNERN